MVFKREHHLVIHRIVYISEKENAKRGQNFDIILFRPIVPYIYFIQSIKNFKLIKKEKYELSDKIKNDSEFYLYRYTSS